MLICRPTQLSFLCAPCGNVLTRVPLALLNQPPVILCVSASAGTRATSPQFMLNCAEAHELPPINTKNIGGRR